MISDSSWAFWAGRPECGIVPGDKLHPQHMAVLISDLGASVDIYSECGCDR
jgi:hypothetical protein